MRILAGLLLALLPLGAWAGPALRAVPLSAPVPRLAFPIPLVSAPALAPSRLSPIPALAPISPAISAPAAPVLITVERGLEAFAAARGEPAQGRALSDLFEGIASRDGSPVYPGVVTPESMAHDGETAAARGELARAAAAALPALEKSVWHGGWRGPGTTLNDSCCGDAAPKLALLLRQMGHAVDVVEAEFHYYLVARLPHGEVFIDPTVRQFFGGARAPPSVPKVFVGTAADLHALFARHAAAKTTSYGVPRIYFRDAVVRNAKLEDVRRLAREKPESPEHQPLADGTAERRAIR
jgi:hypothetical protein